MLSSLIFINFIDAKNKILRDFCFQEHWWVVVCAGILLFILMALFIKCCAVHTPSTNPNKPPALNIYQTLTRPGTLIVSFRDLYIYLKMFLKNLL